MGSFNSDFHTDSVMTLQSWSTIGPNTCPDIRQDWGMRVASEKEQTIIRLIQSIPLDGICGDYCRLDVLLENYLEEIRVMNIFNRKLLYCLYHFPAFLHICDEILNSSVQ